MTLYFDVQVLIKVVGIVVTFCTYLVKLASLDP